MLSADDSIAIVTAEDDAELSTNLSFCRRCSRYLFHPSKSGYRFVALLLICFLQFGSYFCNDNPAALEDDIISDLSLSSTQYGLLYSIYSWPNVIFPLIGGYLVDGALGLRFGAVVFATFIAVGQFVFASGAFFGSFAVMLLGRLLFAVGGENLAVCGNNYAVKWFKGKELNMVFGIQLSFARLGSAVNLYSMKPLYLLVTTVFMMRSFRGLGLTLALGGLTTVLSLCVALILGSMDRRRDRFLHYAEAVRRDLGSSTPPAAVAVHRSVGNSPIEQPNGNSQEDLIKSAELDQIRLRDLLTFSPTFWLLCFACVAYYVAIFPFVGFGLVFFESKFKLAPYPTAEICNSLIYFVSIVASPLCGYVVDLYGRNVYWMMLATCGTILGHALLAFTFLTPFIAVSLMGVCYSLMAASLWPCVAYVVAEKALGTAYGVMQSIQNLGLGLLFLSAGAVVDYRGYFALELYFIFWLCAALSSLIILLAVDYVLAGRMNLSAEKQLESIVNSKKTKTY